MNAITRTWHRIAAMSAHEVAWRARTAGRDALDQVRFFLAPARWDRGALADALDGTIADLDEARRALRAGRWMDAHRALFRHFVGKPSTFVIGRDDLPRVREAVARCCPEAVDAAHRHGDRLLHGWYDLLGFADLDAAGRAIPPGRPCALPDWHADPVHRRRAPLPFWRRVAYLDPRLGDHKIIWELNRHQHWLVLGRAWVLTGQRRYRDAVLAQLDDWMRANPPLAGINWASALELAFRSLSWVGVLHLLADTEDAGARPPRETETYPWIVDLLLGLDRQLRHLERHLSYYFSPNTHLTGEALALYVAGRTIPELRRAIRWADTGRRILIDEISRQIGADGGHAERSMHYQRYTLDFYLLALAVARQTADPIEPRFADAARRLARFTRTLADDTGRLPQIGDDDGGRLWPLTNRPVWDVRDSLAWAAHLLNEPELRVDPTEIPEEAIWLTGGRIAPVTGMAALTPPPRSTALTDTGYVVSRTAAGDLLVFDAGPHGYLNGGHAHADALAVTVTLRGRPLFIDPGTATYTMDPELRDRLRSTALHNALTIDGRSSCSPDGPFHWASTADASLLSARLTRAFDYAEAAHDGYAPRRHRRLVYRLPTGGWAIIDDVQGIGLASLALHWHLDLPWTACPDSAHVVSLEHPDGANAWFVSDAGCTELLRGDPETGLGWCAPVYGPLVPTTTIRCSRAAPLPKTLVSFVLPGGASARPPTLTRVVLAATAPRRPAYAGGVLRHAGRIDVVLAAVDAIDDTAPAASDPTVASLDTDARFLHVHHAPDGPPLRLSIVDGRRLRIAGDCPISIEAEGTIGDLHLVVDPPALLLMSDDPLPPLELQLPDRFGVDRLVVNGTPVERDARTLGGGRWALGSPSAERLPSVQHLASSA